ncbi:MAG: hypothetical protein ACI4S2_06540 [Lachnospiraceae bacterium]
MASNSVTPDTVYANARLPYAPTLKETASGKVIPIPQRKVAEQKKKSGNALFIRLPRLLATIQTRLIGD